MAILSKFDLIKLNSYSLNISGYHDSIRPHVLPDNSGYYI